MASGSDSNSRLAYPGTFAVLGLALAFPIGLMIFNPVLMFERGWEQYVGTTIYIGAVIALGRELSRLRKNERAFESAPGWLEQLGARSGRAAATKAPSPLKLDPEDHRVLPSRLRQIAGSADETRNATISQLMELNRESSGLDQEHATGRFTLPRYILYLLPVIGFIGTVEGISKALMNISKVLPMVKDLDGFMNNLTSVTSALQIAFDSTLLALFLSAALMFVQTLVYRRSEDLLARVDRWVVDEVLPRFGTSDALAAGIAQAIAPQLEMLRRDLTAILEPTARAFETQTEKWSLRLGAQVEQFAVSVDNLPQAFAGFERGAEAIGRLGDDLGALGTAGESLRYGVASLARIENTLGSAAGTPAQLAEIQQGIERTRLAIETLASSWAVAYERSSRSTQEQLAKTMNSLKDALDLLNVSMEQGNALYRNIVKKMFEERANAQGHDTIRAA